ncbi:MAG TPA: glutamine-synthetase adenylyltransferase, partial [Stellaceae bacterium]|nr:glutamine-synthetase adenylyltransferase [Stellaceae bacterium]
MLLPAPAYRSLPPPGDADQARLGLEHWHEAAQEIEEPSLADFMRELAAESAGNRLLQSLFGNSPFLTQCCLREPELLRRLLQQGPDATFAEVEDRLNRDLAAAADQPEVMRTLRQAKRRVALLVAIADIAELWPLERVTGALSDFADRALAASVRHLLAAATAVGEFAPVDAAAPERGSGLIVLDM